MNKKLLSMMIVAVLVVMGSVNQCFACTAVYVGEDVSETGETYFGRSEDMAGHTKRFLVHEAATHEDGEMFEDAYGFSMPYPKETLRYTAIEDSPLYGEGERPYGEVGSNEAGVTISATVSTDYKDEVDAVDPLVETGICEISIAEVVLSYAKTAREGVAYLGSIVEQYGAGECNLIFIADKDETWLFEIVSGHNWAAMKMPADKVAVIANHMIMGTIDVNSEDVMVSENLVSLAKDNGFLVEEDGMINVMKSYSPEYDSYNSYRIWGGSHLLAPSREVGQEDAYYELLYTPENKVSLMDIKNLLSYRYEDTDFSYNDNMEANYEKRPIGVERQSEVHVFEMDDQAVNTQWTAMANIEFSVFVPFYTRLMLDTPDMMKVESLTPVAGQYDWTFRTLTALCALNREQYGAGVREYFDNYQAALIEANKDVVKQLNELYASDPAAAEAKATELAAAVSQEAYEHAKTIIGELVLYMTKEEGNKAGYYGDNEKYANRVAPFKPSLLTDGVYTEYNFNMTVHSEVTSGEEAPVETQPQAPAQSNSTNSVLFALAGAAVGAVATYFITKKKH